MSPTSLSPILSSFSPKFRTGTCKGAASKLCYQQWRKLPVVAYAPNASPAPLRTLLATIFFLYFREFDLRNQMRVASAERDAGRTALYYCSSAATISNGQGYQLATMHGLGINHTVHDSLCTYAYNPTGITDAIQLDGVNESHHSQSDAAFTISATPEPETYAMLSAGYGTLRCAALLANGLLRDPLPAPA